MHPDLLVLRLSNSRVFAELAPAELRMLCDFGGVRELAKGDPVGDQKELLVVLTGSVQVTRGKSSDGTPFTVKLGPGATLNELFFLGREELYDTAHCRKKTTLFTLAHETFAELVKLGNTSAAKIGVALAQSIATRLEERNASLMKLMQQHEALLDSMDRLLTDPQVQEELFGGRAARQQREFSEFRQQVLSNWDY